MTNRPRLVGPSGPDERPPANSVRRLPVAGDTTVALTGLDALSVARLTIIVEDIDVDDDLIDIIKRWVAKRYPRGRRAARPRLTPPDTQPTG